MAAPSSAQSGNILFLILLAVILFAALSYAVTSSMRGGGTSAQKETLSTEIAKLENFALSVRTALLRMTTTGGYQLWQIDYSKSGFSNSAANGACTSDACRLHAADGGGITSYKLSPSLWQKSSVCGFAIPGGHGDKYWFRNISIKGIGIDAKADLTLLYPTVSDELCEAINDKYGIINPGGNPPSDSDSNGGGGFIDYAGTLTQDVVVDRAVELGNTASQINGQQMLCASNSGNGCNYLWIVLYER